MSKTDYIEAHTCVYHVNYHIVWCVKYRKAVLDETKVKFLIKTLYDIADEKGMVISAANVGLEDHVHVFASALPKLSITQVVKYLKGISGRRLLDKYPELRESLWRGQLWNNSYFCETIGSTSKENIKKYIERQKRCQI